jgi:hypothetical protein
MKHSLQSTFLILQNKVGLWDHLAVYVCTCVPLNNFRMCEPPYTTTRRGTRGNRALSLICTLHSSLSHTHYGPQSSLVVSWQLIYTVSLSLQIPHGVLISQSNSFLAIIRQLLIPKTRLNSIPSRPAPWNSTAVFYLTRSFDCVLL